VSSEVKTESNGHSVSRGTSWWRRQQWALPLLVLLVLVVYSASGSADGTVERDLALVSMFALLASGLNLSLGWAGELSFSQAASFAVGAYVTGYTAIHGPADILLSLLLSGVAAAIVGLIVGIPAIRLKVWSLAMVTFFLVLLIPNIAQLLSSETGGFTGLSGIPAGTLFGREIVGGNYTIVCLIVAGLWTVFYRNFVKSSHGHALRILRESPELARSLGIRIYRLKLRTYVISSIPGGLAGTLFAHLDSYVAPNSFTFTVAVSIIAAAIIGGLGSTYGAWFGAAVIQILPLEVPWFEEHLLLLTGVLLVLCGVIVEGKVRARVASLGRSIASRLRSLRPSGAAVATAAEASAAAATTPPDVEQLFGADWAPASLEVRNVSRSFGGVRALRGIDMRAESGKVTALIGPNGSGKTTLLNVICGYYQPDDGSIRLGDDDLVGSSVDRTAAKGVGRTFQTPLVPAKLSAHEAVAAARYSHDYAGVVSAVLRMPKYRRVKWAGAARATAALRLLGVGEHAETEAASLSLGLRRRVEVARAATTSPRLLLLDEPASGLSEGEVKEFSQAVRRLRDLGVAIVLVEHNYALIRELADRIYVLRLGEVLAVGTPAEIDANDEVAESYLGIKRGTQAEGDVVTTSASGGSR